MAVLQEVRIEIPDRLKPGSVVQLKSGGPPLTLGNKFNGGECEVQWFDGGKLCTAWLPLEMLKLVKGAN